MRSGLRMWLALAPLLAWGLAPCEALAAPRDAARTPPPVSGRPLSDPESILPADVLARVELVRANVELLRRFMGKPEAPAALLRVEGAQPHEVHSQAQNLQRRANRLAFEQVRIARDEPLPPTGATGSADNFAAVDSALEAVLLVKQNLGIDTVVAEEKRPEATTASEVFNATAAAGSGINHLLEEETSPSEVFQLITAAVHIAAALHTADSDGPNLPLEPAFEPNKTSEDVYLLLQGCLVLVRELAAEAGMEMLEFEVSSESAASVTPNDVGDLAALVVEELARLHSISQNAKEPARAYYPGKRFPSHAYQRARLLEMILSDMTAAQPMATKQSLAGE